MTELKRILVPLDGSPLGEEALPLAKTLAQPFRSQIILFRVVRFFVTLRGGYQEISPDWEAVAHEHAAYQEAEAYLQAKRDELEAQGFEARILLHGLGPNEEISYVIAAQEVGLIVMATHGRTGLARWVSGSIADKMVRYSRCPVMLVRQSQEDESKGDGKRVEDQERLLQYKGYHQFSGAISLGYG
jgi:nucleotide-binding universal stress UspA family protein